MVRFSGTTAAKARPTKPSAPKAPSLKPQHSRQASSCDNLATASSLSDNTGEEDDFVMALGEVLDPLDSYSQLLVEPSSKKQTSTTDSPITPCDQSLQAFRKLPQASKPRALTQENPRRRSWWRRNWAHPWQPSLKSVVEEQQEEDENPDVDNDSLDDDWIKTDLEDEVWSIHSNDSAEAIDKTEVKEVKEVKEEAKEEASMQQTEQCCAKMGKRMGTCAAEHQEHWHPKVHPLFAARYGNDPNWCIPPCHVSHC
ncbi:hypothetical protein F5Y13DRAFT_156597 [Hypoxylon sp. FL1857]|nr:hypothetical protein F5Y13DRAFT_156597 [Hypoxylon sp. FL1857]